MKPVMETKAKKEKIQVEIRKLLASLRSGTLDRRKLETGLKKMQGVVLTMPDHDDRPR
jgi:hypothetical protein